MKIKAVFLTLLAFAALLACSEISSENMDKIPPLKQQTVDGTLIADGNNEKTYELIKRAGYNHEAPDSSRVHQTKHFQHIQQVYDSQLNEYVFSFFIHAAIDDDRGLENITDRQRNEIKTDNKSPENLVGQSGEMIVFRWKFRLPAGFQTTTKFSHLHQLKGIDNPANTADVGSPLLTLTAYSGNKGGQELRVRYDKRGEGTTTLASTNLADFLGNWVEVEEKVLFGENGSYEVVITRLKDGKVLLKLNPKKMDMWRTDCIGLRPKWGIYRYLGENRSWQNQLRDEEIRFADFSIKKQ
ncbi:MAG: polysaccharide lyase [Parabacteroides sp.]|nr:polysaccharide lyase [Parabacteroides sp.]